MFWLELGDKFGDEPTGLLWHNGTLMFWLELGDKFGDEPTGFLWVQITNLLWDIHKGSNNLVMTLFRSLLKGTSSTTDLNGELLTRGVSNKLAWLFLNILGAAG